MVVTGSEARPRLRGVSHHAAFYVALVSGTVLVASAGARRALLATTVYVVFLAGMFGASALLHSHDWGPRATTWLRRVDHAMIFGCIAGTYTPFCVLGLDSPAGTRLLVLAWAASGLGILRALFWTSAPRAITSSLYIAVGWAVLAYLPEVHAGLDPTAFGYHEVFHVLIILGCLCHFAGVLALAR
jgi:hemolysin III